MEEKNLVYGISVLGLLFIPERRAEELAQVPQALVNAKTWGAFKALVSEEFYNFYLVRSSFYQGPNTPSAEEIKAYDLPPETLFTPNDVVLYDAFHAHPEIEMSEWMPDEIQEKYGKKMRYYAMDMNVPDGDILCLPEEQMDEIANALEQMGYHLRRDDDLINAATTLDFDPDEFPDIDDDGEEDDEE